MAVFDSTHDHDHDHDHDDDHSCNIVMISNHNNLIQLQVHGSRTWRIPFQIFTVLLLTLLLPLSFLLLARLSASRYLFVLLGSSTANTPAAFLVMYNGFSVVLYALVSLVTVAALVHGLTVPRSTFLSPPEPVDRRPRSTRLCLAWVLLCGFQVCVGLGIEGTISAGIDGSGFASETNNSIAVVIARALLFVGLHETMSFWSRSVVKPVVKDTVTVSVGGGSGMTERVGVALSLGALWWWRLREEVDALVVVPELMLAGGVAVGVAELFGWWLYYLTVSIGTVRLLKGVTWVGIRIGLMVSSAVAAVRRNKIDKDDGQKTDECDSSYDYVSHVYRQLHRPLEEDIV